MKIKKVKVIEMFRDKYTNEVYELDQVLEVDEKRHQEIKNYVEEITEAEETKETETKNKGNKKKGE